MTQTHEFAEQLSAYMDGELSEEEARFLLRRLEHDAELRAAWTRMQLASNCLRSQPWRPMDEAFAGRVAASLADAPEKLNSDPHGDAWLVKIRLSNPGEIQNLMSASDYQTYVGAEK